MTDRDDARAAWSRMRELVLQADNRKAAAEALGMSFQRVKALGRIARQDLAHHELAAYLGTDKPYTTVIIRDLLDRGLVESRPHPQDGRSKVVSVTPAGRALAEQADELLARPPEALLGLDDADLAELVRILGLLQARIGSTADTKHRRR
jgi:DNA-binding MarR family transcriptional regulator